MVKQYRSLDALDSMDALSSMNPSGQQFCPECGNRMQRHGLLNGDQYVCPGDYIVTNRDGLYYRLSRGEFEGVYEPYVRPPRFAARRPSDLEERKQNHRSREERE